LLRQRGGNLAAVASGKTIDIGGETNILLSDGIDRRRAVDGGVDDLLRRWWAQVLG
jgi:hypothetical protein